MKALCWHGKSNVRVDRVPDPKIEEPRDVVVKITLTAICGSDLHLYDGYMPTMESGDIIGHEPMGVVVEVGKEVKNLKKGDRVVVPFTISCGTCWFCRRSEFSLCDTSNPNAKVARDMMGQSPAGLLGYSHMLGGFPGGRRSTSAYRSPTWDRSRSSPTFRMNRSSSSPTSSRPATWPPRTPGSRPGHGGGLGLRPRRPIRDQERVDARGGPGDRHRLRPRAAPHGRAPGKGRDHQFSEGDGLRPVDGADQRPRSRLLHRRRRRRGARRVERGRDARQGEDGRAPGTDRPHVLREAIMCCRKGVRFRSPGSTSGSSTRSPSARR